MMTNANYWFLLILIFLVYLAGMPVTLLENDSAQFAVMAMRMVQENDFLNLFKGPHEYLDKPHMHYWLAALSFKVFGIHDWAYRIPGVLALFLGAYSCFGLGKLVYDKNVGKLAALIFLTAQTIVLSGIDVRTDAILTGFTILAIWQLVAYVEKGSLKHILWGGFGAGMAFSTKGQIALLVIGIALFCHILYTRRWKAFLSWKVLLALIVFGISIAPMLYAYYHQFDLHPEKVIRGRTHRSGIFFIFWEQSFERMSGQGMGKNSSDYFFFFHTYLWVFLPWTILGLLAYWKQLRTFVKLRFRYAWPMEFLTLGAITLLFFIISFAQFKLPHYMNILMPLFALMTAGFVVDLRRNGNRSMLRALMGFHYFLFGVVVAFSLVVAWYVFPLSGIGQHMVLISALGVALYAIVQPRPPYLKLVLLGVTTSLVLNGLMNLHFYPELLKYQAGSTLAKEIATENIPVDAIYKISDRHSWSLDFYNRHPATITSVADLQQLKNVWVYADAKELETLQKNGVQWDRKITADHFRITRLQLKFLIPDTRPQKLGQMHLVHLP